MFIHLLFSHGAMGTQKKQRTCNNAFGSKSYVFCGNYKFEGDRLNSPYVAPEGHRLRRRSTRCRLDPKAQVKNFYGQIISMAYFSVWYEWNNEE